jgi:ABC-type phosphate transport system substrate-binding protein
LPGARYHTIGIGAVALLVHPSNPISEVDLATARKLFGGDIASWADLPVSGVGTPGKRVNAVARLHCAARPGHWRLLLDNANLFSMQITEVPAIADMLKRVAEDQQAIGYETLWHVRDKLGDGKVKGLRLDGHAPDDDEALTRGHYPLYRVFNITSWTDAPAADPRAAALAQHLVDSAERIPPSFGIVPASRLRPAGWRFVGNEVVGEPVPA